MYGKEMYEFIKRIFPICRSITGNGVRETLSIMQEYAPEIKVHEVPSGTAVFDWTVPAEWNIEDAYVENEAGERVIDFKETNLSVVGYSLPMDEYMSLEELKKIVFVEENQPDVIPYVTSYYRQRSAFCTSKNRLNALKEGTYHCVIKSSLNPEGSLTYGEAFLPGESEKEILISTYLCHPSMANNECSGPAVSLFLFNYIKGLPKRKYSYRFIYIPETIGSITYLSRNIEHLKKNVISGVNLSCVGDNDDYSFVQSRYGNTLTDQMLHNLLSFHYPEYKAYSFLERGSDERQFCAPGVDLPVCSFCRTKYGKYEQYHTSADDLDYISPEGLAGALEFLMKYVQAMEHNEVYRILCLCEPQLGKRGLYPTVSKKGSYDAVKAMTDFIAYADGTNDLLSISNIIKQPMDVLIPIAEKLLENNLIECVDKE
ncbi:MAG: DUF4910 domain-containing protein [Lachnospiraceae bacterium]|nr:DUF4910 domain-containing protein [Lachnospiraceae bacterium]